MFSILAQGAAGFSIVHWIIVIIIVAAVIGIMFVVLRQMGVQIPGFIVQIGWILLAAVVGIIAIKFLLSLAW